MSLASRRGLTPLQVLFVAAYDGDPERTAERINIDPDQAVRWSREPWFLAAVRKRCDREAKNAEDDRVAQLRAAVADRTEIQALWSAVMRGNRVPITDPATGLPELNDNETPRFTAEPSTKDRLAAAKLLADSLGMNVQTIVHEGGDKPIEIRHVELEERLALLGARRIAAHQPTADWLS